MVAKESAKGEKSCCVLCPGGYLLSPRMSIIGTTALNGPVRNGKGCDHCVKPPRQKTQQYPPAGGL